MSGQIPRSDTMPAPLVPPTGHGYLLLAAVVDRRLPFLPDSRRKRMLLSALAEDIASIERAPDVTQALVFNARLVPPGRGHELLRARGVAPARFDVVVLIETVDPDAAAALKCDASYARLRERLTASATQTYEVAARNVRRIADVDHDKSSVFLLNFFYADDPRRLLTVWEDTAGWFVAKTALPDSTVFQPLPGERADYGIINHASWPHLRTFLPHLIVRPSFRRFVLATFESNGIAAQAILYRRVEPQRLAARAGDR